jgi:CheY-like chemotaxis protein
VAPSAFNGSDRLVILVVEDEVLLRGAIADYLRDCGCLVLEAESAEQATAICRSGRVLDVLMTDINLNGPGTGWDIAETLRAAQPNVGVLYVSGHSIDPGRCVSGSFCLNKPYLNAAILQTCQMLTESRRRGGELQ